VLAVSGLLVSVAWATSGADLLIWNGVRYDGAGGDLAGHVRFGGEIGEALIPACDDTGDGSGPGCEGEDGTAVPVLRLSGVDSQLAVGTRAAGRAVYLAAGYFPELPNHPLHMAIYGTPRRPNERAGWRCEAPIPDVLGAVVNETPGWGWVFQVRFEDERIERDAGRTALIVDAQTQHHRLRQGWASTYRGGRSAPGHSARMHRLRRAVQGGGRLDLPVVRSETWLSYHRCGLERRARVLHSDAVVG
jgi:hypothetical protein